MQIPEKVWIQYIQKMSEISEKAAQEMQAWIDKHGFKDDQKMLEYAFALSTHYGEAVAALSCQMYDAMAEAQGAIVKAAEAATTPDFREVAIAVHGTMKQSEKKVPSTIGRLVKQAGADTTRKNAQRDGAQFAWVPHGDTCAFCIALASRGWQYEDPRNRRPRAEHIHANCDCQYAVRFDGESTVEGYDPKAYKDMYYSASPGNSKDKINALRRRLEEQKRQLSFDKSNSETRRRVTEFTAFKAKESRYGIYVSENANRKTQNLSNIEKVLDTALDKLGIKEKEQIPRIFVLAQEEMGTDTFAAYNAVKNELYLSDTNGNKKKNILIQRLMGFADAESPDSTVRHELIHWRDAEKYRKTGAIESVEEYKQYLQHLRKDCKIKLDKAGITAENVALISNYAAESYARGKYDEVYTEYRVLKSGGRNVHRK